MKVPDAVKATAKGAAGAAGTVAEQGAKAAQKAAELLTTESGVVGRLTAPARTAAALAAAGAHKLADLADRGADVAAPESTEDVQTADQDAESRTTAPPVTDRGPKKPRAATPAPAATAQPVIAADAPGTDVAQARTYESHVAELGSQNARDVVKKLKDLSTEELEALYDYESEHRKRKSVFAAIEAELAPPAEQVVHSTETT